MTNTTHYAVLGAGHGGQALAGYLSLKGFKVNLYNRTPDRLNSIKLMGGIQVEGEIQGFASLNLVTSSIEEAVKDVEIIMVVVPANGQRFMAENLVPFLKDGQIIVLNPGRTGGALECRQIFKERNVTAQVIISEAQTFLFASRINGPAQVKIFRIKNSIPVAAIPAYKTIEVVTALRKALPQFVPEDNVLKTSFNNIGAVFHPTLTILNAARIENTHGEFDYYIDGITPSVALILEAVDNERVKVAEALGIRAITAREWLYSAYDAYGRNLYEAMQNNPGYRGIQAPYTIYTRYITEDVPMSLVPISSFGKMLQIPTPTIDCMIHLANILHNRDYFAEGRTIEKLGLAGLSVKEIREMVVVETNSG
ncbi:MAG: NAD/NADP octopine/nopaline dehydrogenase family protein [Candidatus Atribacteria bacterium]|jgi:opine dehydrogenase|nr:NAD/NADP octopine/nopaline dehydrogenase family protein [Candidatus Atribacteria bacterium]